MFQKKILFIFLLFCLISCSRNVHKTYSKNDSFTHKDSVELGIGVFKLGVLIHDSNTVFFRDVEKVPDSLFDKIAVKAIQKAHADQDTLIFTKRFLNKLTDIFKKELRKMKPYSIEGYKSPYRVVIGHVRQFNFGLRNDKKWMLLYDHYSGELYHTHLIYIDESDVFFNFMIFERRMQFSDIMEGFDYFTSLEDHL